MERPSLPFSLPLWVSVIIGGWKYCSGESVEMGPVENGVTMSPDAAAGICRAQGAQQGLHGDQKAFPVSPCPVKVPFQFGSCPSMTA